MPVHAMNELLILPLDYLIIQAIVPVKTYSVHAVLVILLERKRSKGAELGTVRSTYGVLRT